MIWPDADEPGVAPAFIRALLENGADDVASIVQAMKAFVDENTPPGADGQV